MAELMERVVAKANMNRAYKRVKSNKGKPGIDGMTTEELFNYLKIHGEELKQQLLNNKYKPQPIRVVYIPKANGGKRKLGIPTAVDRFVQQAILQVLEEELDELMSESSFAFRKNKSAHQAMLQAQEYVNQGYVHVVDIDLEKYFDTIPQDRLMSLFSKTILDSEIRKTLGRIMRSGATIDGVEITPTKVGVPQGGPLSPLLANLYLNELDKELDKRGHKYVRYADDLQIYVKSKRAGERVMEGVTKILEKKLHLKVNQEKSAVKHIMKSKFLGFSMYPTKDGYKLCVHKESIKRLKDKIRKILKRNRGRNITTILEELAIVTRGWINYYALADMKNHMVKMDSWIRRKIRTYMWKGWKKIKTRFKMLRRYGISESKAWEFSNTRKGYWKISKSPILHRTLTDDIIRDLGFRSLSELYHKAHIKFL